MCPRAEQLIDIGGRFAGDFQSDSLVGRRVSRIQKSSRLRLEKMCRCDECLEPLCLVCVREHYKIHDHLGFPPNFVPYEAI